MASGIGRAGAEHGGWYDLICMGYLPIGLAFGVLSQKAGLAPSAAPRWLRR